MIVAMKVAAVRDPAMKAKLVAEYVSGVAEHVRTLIGRGPAAADVEAALSRLEARPPSDWNEVISDSGMWHSGALSALREAIESPGIGRATTFLYRFRSEHEKFLGTDFADLQRELRGREDVIWMTLSSREEQAGRFALALALAQQGWSRPRFGLRGRAARAWFEREFAALDFPGRREMPSLTDASAEALWKAWCSRVGIERSSSSAAIGMGPCSPRRVSSSIGRVS